MAMSKEEAREFLAFAVLESTGELETRSGGRSCEGVSTNEVERIRGEVGEFPWHFAPSEVVAAIVWGGNTEEEIARMRGHLESQVRRLNRALETVATVLG